MEQELQFHQPSNCYYRLNSYDVYIWKEARTYARLPLENARVLDIGGCIGSFAALCVDRNVELVCSYEPDPDNCRVFMANMNNRQRDKWWLYKYAVVENNYQESEIKLYINDKTNKGLHSVIPKRGRNSITVPVLTLKSQLECFKPSILKVDIEGYEYSLLSEPLPDHVKHIAVELHRTTNDFRQMAPVLYRNLEAQGFMFHNPLDLNIETCTSWAVLAIGSRE